jgi:hypothetical protein
MKKKHDAGTLVHGRRRIDLGGGRVAGGKTPQQRQKQTRKERGRLEKLS